MSIRLSLLAATILAAAALPAQAVPLVGLVGPNQLVGFDSATPGTVTSTLTVTGLGSEVIRGIDTRPSNGMFYGYGQSGSLFTVNTTTGAATILGNVPGSGIDYGFAFNPVPDAIRIVNANDQNLRVSPVTGALIMADGTLAYAGADVNAGRNPTVTAVAYTNQVPGMVMSTTLYGLDAATDSLVIQNPPNAGTLNTVGALGVDLFDFGTGAGQGFDIDGATGLAFASLTLNIGTNGLYSINLGTGAATLIGAFGANTVRDIAVGTIGAATNVPEPASMTLLGLGLAGLMVARRRTI